MKQIVVVFAPFEEGPYAFDKTKAFIIESEEEMNDKVREWFTEAAAAGCRPNSERLPMISFIENDMIKEVVASWDDKS